MTILLFIIILAVLILVHELGHFLAAKRSGVRVEEFGLGLPPRMIGKKFGETIYSLNWIPFGGFVRIFGEDPTDAALLAKNDPQSFLSKNRGIQVIILAAGVTFNVIFGWLLISTSLLSGAPAPVSYEGKGIVHDPVPMITAVLPEAPAKDSGMKSGDVIKNISSSSGKEITPSSADEALAFIQQEENATLTFSLLRAGKSLDVTVTPKEGVIADKKAIGVALDDVGTLKLGLIPAFIEGARLTGHLLKAVTVGLFGFIADAVRGQADLSAVTGPVGIAGMVGDASHLGVSYLLTFTALISFHLAVINLLPFPALDGGRILFVAIEAIKRSPINPKVSNTINAIGFAILILLMIVITYRDIVRLF